MIILDKPFVSDLLIDTLVKNQICVLETEFSEKLNLPDHVPAIDNERAIIEYNACTHPKIYSNSENAIYWINRHLKKTEIPFKVNLFKDKVRFRTLLSDLYPDFYFKEILFSDIEKLDIEQVPKPFIIKPAIGFFSLGVHKVANNNDWDDVVRRIKDENDKNKKYYPDEVLNTDTFIIEQLIEGDEYAFDAYYNSRGVPVVLGIFKHLFSSDSDVSDRVYFTSKDIIETYLQAFTDFCSAVGKKADLKNFPVHIEVRVDATGAIMPIEINPMRFGGWCTTADLTTFAFNLNPYEYYFKELMPDWPQLLKNKEGLHYCLIILDNTTGYTTNEIADFDYDAVLKRFIKPIELRKINWNEYPLFGILFTETHSDNYSEIELILKSDLKEFVTLK